MRLSDHQDEQDDFVALVAPVADDDARLPIDLDALGGRVGGGCRSRRPGGQAAPAFSMGAVQARRSPSARHRQLCGSRAGTPIGQGPDLVDGLVRLRWPWIAPHRWGWAPGMDSFAAYVDRMKEFAELID